MKISLSRKGRVCKLATQPLEQLSTEALQKRKIATEEMAAIVGLLMVSVVGMAIWSELYPLILTSVGMLPLLNEYVEKRRAIVKQLNKRM